MTGAAPPIDPTSASTPSWPSWKLDGTVVRLDEWNEVAIVADDLSMKVETEIGSVPLTLVATLLRNAGWTVQAPARKVVYNTGDSPASPSGQWIRENALWVWDQWKAEDCPGTWPDYLASALEKEMGPVL